MENIFATEEYRQLKIKNLSIPIHHFKLALILFVFGKMFIYFHISYAHSIKYFMLVIICVGICTATEILYYWWLKRYPLKDAYKMIEQTYPYTTGLLISASLNYGYRIYPVIICTFIAVIVARLLYGGYLKNIFSAPAFAIVLLHSTYKEMTLNLSMNGNFDKFFLKACNLENSHHIIEFANLNNSLYFDRLPYLDISIIAVNIAFIVGYLIYFKIVEIDTFMAIRIIMFLFIICYSFIGFLNGTSYLDDNFIQFSGFFKHLINLTGIIGHATKAMLLFFYLIVESTATGIILFTVFSKNIPNTKIGKYFVSFIIAIIIFYTKVFTNNPYGYFYGLIIVNAITPMLNNTIACSQINKNIVVISLIILSLLVGFISFVFAIRGRI